MEDYKEEYARVSTRVWLDEDFRDLSVNAKMVFFRCITGPEYRSIGAAHINTRAIADDCGLTDEEFQNCWGEITLDVTKYIREMLPNGVLEPLPEPFAKPFAERLPKPFSKQLKDRFYDPSISGKFFFFYDSKARLLIAPNAFQHNPIANENVAKAAVKSFLKLPECTLRDTHFIEFMAHCERLGKPLPKPFPEPLAKRLPEQLLERYGNTTTTTTVVVQRAKNARTPHNSASTKSGKSRTKKPKPALKDNEIAILQKIEDAWNAGAGDTIQTVKELATQDYARDVLRAFAPTASIGMTLPDPGSVTRFVRWASNRDYLNGSDGNWSITLKWLVRPDKIDKVLDQLGQFQAEGDDRVVGAVSIEELDREHIEALTRKFSERVQMHWGDDAKLAKDKSDLADACNRVGLKIDWGEIVKIAESNLAGV